MTISIAISRLGMTPRQVYGVDGVTPLELYNALKDKGETEEAHLKNRWEVMRMQVVSIHNMFQTKKKNRIKNPQSFMRFPWEEDYHSKKEQTVEEQKEILSMVFGKPKRKELKDGR